MNSVMKVCFKTLIPKIVVDWIKQQEVEDIMLNAQIRLKRRLSMSNPNSHFYSYGSVQDVEIKDGVFIGNCEVIFNVDNEEDARKEFKKIFSDLARKGQKFKMISFEKIIT